MKAFFLGIMVGFMLAVYFIKFKGHKHHIVKDEENTEYLFPLKPDLEPENKEKDKEK